MRFKQYLMRLAPYPNRHVIGGAYGLFQRVVQYDNEHNYRVRTKVSFDLLGDWANTLIPDVIRREDAY